MRLQQHRAPMRYHSPVTDRRIPLFSYAKYLRYSRESERHACDVLGEMARTFSLRDRHRRIVRYWQTSRLYFFFFLLYFSHQHLFEALERRRYLPIKTISTNIFRDTTLITLLAAIRFRKRANSHFDCNYWPRYSLT